MPNVLLTTSCNLSCSYCFAKERMMGRPQHMPMENVEKVLAFLKKSSCPLFRVMGGEPTLHPHFRDIVLLALREGMHVDILSNATWHESYNELFASVSPRCLRFLLNIDHPDGYSPRLWAKIEKNLAALAGRSGLTLSFNIFESEPRSDYVLELASKYSVSGIRLSFSLPVLGIDNACLPLEQYEKLAPFVIDFTRTAAAAGLRVQLDNAVPLCMFSMEEVGELLLNGVLDLRRNARCDPIIDIGPDLTVWCCFCLSKLFNRHLDDFHNLEEIQEYYRQVIKTYQDDIFPLEKCYTCRYRELWECQGGCITFSILQDRGEHLAHELISQTDLLDTPLQVAEGVSVQQFSLPKECYLLTLPNSQDQVELDASFRALWPLLDGRHGSHEISRRLAANGADCSGNSFVEMFVRQTTEENILDILSGLTLRRFLVAKKDQENPGRE